MIERLLNVLCLFIFRLSRRREALLDQSSQDWTAKIFETEDFLLLIRIKD
jgi:hypothetical protein